MSKPQQEPETVLDAEVVPDDQLREAVQDTLGSTAIAVADPGDQREGMIAMDANDAARLLDRLTRQAQEHNLGKRWVYELQRSGKFDRGLTIDAVQDITQQMSWTGKCSIALLPDTLNVESLEADEGDGPEPFWVATIFAIDHRTGQTHVGTSMEPQKMKLRVSTAEAKRKEGKPIPEDNRIFDRFSRTKAIGKASRNALEAFIPEVVKVTLIAMAAKNPQLVERIQSDAEARVSELPPPLDTDEAREAIAELGRMYDEVRELGGGKGKILLPPGQFNAYLVQSQHSMELLARMKGWLEQRRDEIRAEVE